MRSTVSSAMDGCASCFSQRLRIKTKPTDTSKAKPAPAQSPIKASAGESCWPPKTTTELLQDALVRLAMTSCRRWLRRRSRAARPHCRTRCNEAGTCRARLPQARSAFRRWKRLRRRSAPGSTSFLKPRPSSAQRSPWIGRTGLGIHSGGLRGPGLGTAATGAPLANPAGCPTSRPCPGAASAREWQLWLEDARKAAAAGQWREAIHFVYWAAISRLESRRLWPADRARTPREYLALVAPEDPRRPAWPH
jgi:hypothetical protein